MKRILLLSALLICLLSLFACGNKNHSNEGIKNDTGGSENNGDVSQSPDSPAHVCTYSAMEEKFNPTCESGGYTIVYCSCGEYKIKDEVQALGHEYDAWGVDIVPTTTTTGMLMRTCMNGQHADYMTLPILSERDYTISAIDENESQISCVAPSYVYYTLKEAIYDSATLSERKFIFEGTYTAPHTPSNSEYLFLSNSHYKKCSVCSGFDESSAEAHSLNNGKCSICDYVHTDVTYTKKNDGLAVSYNTNDSEVIIPEYYCGSDVSLIGKRILGIKSFSANNNLRVITIPSSVKYIDSYAFNGCTSLEKVYYDGTIEDWCNIEFGANGNPMNYAFKFYMKNKSSKYEEITAITITDTVTVIRDSAFEGFTSLTSLTLPKSISALGDNLNDIFSENTKITNVYYKGDIEDWCKIKINARFSNPMQFTDNFYMTGIHGDYYKPSQFNIPEEITEIGDYQFISFTHLNIIYAKASLTKIGKYAFKDCSGILSVDFSRGCELLDAYAFSGCSMLTRMYLPKNLSCCNDFVFEDCNALREIYYLGDWDSWCGLKFSTAKSNPMHINEGKTFEASVNFYRYFEEDDEFLSADGEIVTLTSSIEAIGNCQFYGFSRIAQIIIPESVKEIGQEAFAYCKNLSAVVIPRSVKAISKNIFLGTANLVEIYYVGSWDEWNNININSINEELNRAYKYYYAPTEADIRHENSWGFMPSGMIGKWLWDSYEERWYLF